MLGSLTPTTSSDDPINDILSRYDLFISKPKEKDAWLLLVFFCSFFTIFSSSLAYGLTVGKDFHTAWPEQKIR